MYKSQDKIKAARVANGFSQQQMADLLNIERSTYSAYEKGKTEPTYSVGIKMAQIFMVEDSWLLTDEPVKYILRSDSIFSSKFQKKDYGDTMGDLDKDEREIIAYYRLMKMQGKDENLKEFIQKELSQGENEE